MSKYLGKEFEGKCISHSLKNDLEERLPIFHLAGGIDRLEKEDVKEEDSQDNLPCSG